MYYLLITHNYVINFNNLKRLTTHFSWFLFAVNVLFINLYKYSDRCFTIFDVYVHSTKTKW